MCNIGTYNISRKLFLLGFKLLPKLFERMGVLLHSCDISFKADISKNVVFAHAGIGVIIGECVKIGHGCKIEPNVTIGGRGKYGGQISIGNNVLIGAGAVLIGTFNIGDNAKIGANAVVLGDVPEGATAVGVPAKIIQRNIQ